MADAFYGAVAQDSRLIVGLAITTDVCRDAQQTHGLESTSAIALGRLLTATALVARANKHHDLTSLQALCSGRLGQLFADINDQGHLRGYIKNPLMALPAMPDERQEGRRTIAPGVAGGTLSVIRSAYGAGFTQGVSDIVSGEIDADVQRFLETSDQVPTILVCDVLLDAQEQVFAAGGITVQAMPDAAMDRFEAAKAGLLGGRFADLLGAHLEDTGSLVHQVLANAHEVGQPQPLRYKCRCSYERVLAALAMLRPDELADMVNTKERPAVSCEFCGHTYVVEPPDVERVFRDTITARG